MHIATVSEYICRFAFLCLEDLVSFLSSILSLALTVLVLSFLQGFLSPEGKELMETSHLVLSVPRSLTLYTLSLYLFPDAAGGGGGISEDCREMSRLFSFAEQ